MTRSAASRSASPAPGSASTPLCTSAWATSVGLVDISNVALLYRLRQCGDWLAVLVVGPAPAYDPWSYLLWGREVVHGTLDTAEGPAFKPLAVALGAVLAPLGDDLAPAVWVLLARTASIAAVALGYIVGHRLGGTVAGVLAAGFRLTIPPAISELPAELPLKYESGNALFVVPYADGSVVMSVRDMAKWDIALYTEKPFPKAVREAMWTPAKRTDGKPTAYGYGWQLGERNGHRFVGHGGAWQGFTATILRYPEDRLSVVVLTNRAGVNPGPIAARVAGMYLPAVMPKAPAPPAPRARPPSPPRPGRSGGAISPRS